MDNQQQGRSLGGKHAAEQLERDEHGRFIGKKDKDVGKQESESSRGSTGLHGHEGHVEAGKHAAASMERDEHGRFIKKAEE